MSVPNVPLLKVTLEKLAKELKSDEPNMASPGMMAWKLGYQAGQWDAGFHIEELLRDFFDYEDPKNLS